MKFKFDPNLDYQLDAINSIVDIFEGQEISETNFTVANTKQMSIKSESDLGVGNRLALLDEDILKNVRKIQLRNGLKQSRSLTSKDFSIEMETGTGKTYVYLRTLFELNKKYGFTKFVIVVPSIAIKEGVYKSLQMTEEHFKMLYDNVPYDYFIYDSQKLGQVRNFATNDYIQIMVINIDAFRKSFKDPSKQSKANIIHRRNDRLNGLKPIEFIQETNPIVVIDEPQSVDTTQKAKKAIASLNPLCKLRYSATHQEKYNMMYKLDSVDAYERKLVKQIEVASVTVKDSHNKAYIKLLDVTNSRSPITAKIEIDVNKKGSTKRVERRVKQGDDLYEISGGREVYRGYIINDIYCEEGYEYIDFTSKPEVVKLGETIGHVKEDDIKRLQIRKTIEEHLNKELRLRKKGIKVLSLFFIDRVANYRYYDDEGYPHKGKYAHIFEEEYKKLVNKPKYHSLFEEVESETKAEKVHNGYFAIDPYNKDAYGEQKIKDSKGIYRADENAYNLIMKDKERLLSFDSKLKFIFSHSALKEGWDNPNVFQICTLNETKSQMKKRQEIGRGLRIAVDQEGERHPGFDVNTLTVMANESYEEFAEQLQKEIEEEEGIKFGVVEKHTFANVTTVDENGDNKYLGEKASKELWNHLLENDYINDEGLVKDRLKEDLKINKLDIPDKYEEEKLQIQTILKKIAGKLNIKNHDDKQEVNLNKVVYLDEDFKKLWEKIKYKTTYSVDFNTKELIEKCAEEIKNNLIVGKTKLVYQKAKQEISRGGVTTESVHETEYIYQASDYSLPDIISYIQNETQLTRETIVKILVKSERLDDFKSNPQKFIDEVLFIIQNKMRSFIVDGIKYQKIGEDEFYAQELFEEEELYGYLSKNMVEANKSVYNYVVYDSEVEKEFALKFERSENVKVYAKLPNWFRIDTPLGSYNPDWAVLVEKNGEEKLYFVVESKGSVNMQLLREIEKDKIKCGREHFKALESGAKYTVADTFERFMEQI